MFTPPPANCGRCPRLCEYRAANCAAFPDKHNAPVPSFGPLSARILFIGLAPGLRGANFTGRPFTGDYAGDLLYPSLIETGLAQGEYAARPDDDLRLIDCRISNAVRCVPPQNKPLPAEFKACRPFLADEIAAMTNLRALFAIGRNAHEEALTVLGVKKSAHAFAHGAAHALPGGLILIDSYHCSRYNTNTGRLTPLMFRQALLTLIGATQT